MGIISFLTSQLAYLMYFLRNLVLVEFVMGFLVVVIMVVDAAGVMIELYWSPVTLLTRYWCYYSICVNFGGYGGADGDNDGGRVVYLVFWPLWW